MQHVVIAVYIKNYLEWPTDYGFGERENFSISEWYVNPLKQAKEQSTPYAKTRNAKNGSQPSIYNFGQACGGIQQMLFNSCILIYLTIYVCEPNETKIFSCQLQLATP